MPIVYELADPSPVFLCLKEIAMSTDLELIKDSVKVSLSWIGEGLCGDYDENDTEDEKLLRFDVYKYVTYEMDYPSEWKSIEDASYCTLIRDDATDKAKIQCMIQIMEEVYDKVSSNESIKKICECLSHLSE